MGPPTYNPIAGDKIINLVSVGFSKLVTMIPVSYKNLDERLRISKISSCKVITIEKSLLQKP